MGVYCEFITFILQSKKMIVIEQCKIQKKTFRHPVALIFALGVSKKISFHLEQRVTSLGSFWRKYLLSKNLSSVIDVNS